MKLFNYWRSSSSYRVRIALHFKGLPFEYVPVSLIKGEQHEAPHRHRNPLGTVPLLEVEDEGQTLLIPQSVAIVEYLEERWPTPALFPASRGARAQMRALVEQINSGIQPFHNLSTLNLIKNELKADEKRFAKHQAGVGLAVLEQLASKSAGRFLVGDAFTWADACLVPQLFGARRLGIESAEYPLLARIEATCLELDAVKASLPERQVDAQP
jgi:maleylpyruvate isomerase